MVGNCKKGELRPHLEDQSCARLGNLVGSAHRRQKMRPDHQAYRDELLGASSIYLSSRALVYSSSTVGHMRHLAGWRVGKMAGLVGLEMGLALVRALAWR